MKAKTLFPLEPNQPEAIPIPGLRLIDDFVSAATEKELVGLIDQEPWDTTWDRRRQLYGRSYGRGNERVAAIPDWGLALIDRLQHERVSERPFNQMLVNEYLPGQGIALHRDYEPFDRIVVSLSLLAPCVMDFRRVADSERRSLLLKPRSLLILQDEARYEWEHGIARRKNDRWEGVSIPRARRLSVTFRRAKEPA